MKYSRDQSHRGAEPLHLLLDGAAVVLLPIPDALDECLAAHVAAVLALVGELALHHHLRGDAGVVGAGQPQRGQPRMRCQRMMMSISVCSSMWPMCRVPVTLGGGSVMVKVWPAAIGGRRVDVEELFVDPVFGPARFDRARFVGLGKIVRHSCPFRELRSNLDTKWAGERRQTMELSAEGKPQILRLRNAKAALLRSG